MADDEKKSVRLEVDKDTHQKWMDYVDESDDCNTLSSLIRSAVTREIAHGSDQHRGGSVEVDLDPVENALYDLEERLAGVEDEMRSLDLAADATGDATVKKLMHHVRPLLPLVEDEEQLKGLSTEAVLPPDERAQLSGEINDIAEALRVQAVTVREKDEASETLAEDADLPEDDAEWIVDVDVWDVERALERLQREVGPVNVMVESGTRRYYEVKQ